MYLAAILSRTLVLVFAWWVLTEGQSGSWGVGVVTASLALIASLILVPPTQRRISPAGALVFAAFFLRQSIMGGIQVASLALRPRLDLAPAVLELPLSLPAGPARIWLVYTLNLLPGTVCLGIDGDVLRLHALDGRQPIEAEVRKAERQIARLLGIGP